MGAQAWQALADGTRRAIMERLLMVRRPWVNWLASQHLKVLKAAGLVCDRAAGTRRVYQLDPTGLEALRADLDRFWTQALTSYAQTIDIEGDRG